MFWQLIYIFNNGQGLEQSSRAVKILTYCIGQQIKVIDRGLRARKVIFGGAQLTAKQLVDMRQVVLEFCAKHVTAILKVEQTFTCQPSCIMCESHTCGSKTSISRIEDNFSCLTHNSRLLVHSSTINVKNSIQFPPKIV